MSKNKINTYIVLNISNYNKLIITSKELPNFSSDVIGPHKNDSFVKDSITNDKIKLLAIETKKVLKFIVISEKMSLSKI